MKKLIFTLFVFHLSLFVCEAAPRVVKSPAQQLLDRMAHIQKKGYMYGHQDDPFYGITWEWESGRSDTYELVGDYPGVMGFDLGGIEKGDLKNLDSVPFTRIREEIIAHHQRGGIITLSWHLRNPLLGTTAWIESDIKAYDEAVAALQKVGRPDLIRQLDNPRHTVRAMIPGGKVHDQFTTWLRRLTDFITSLRDSRGNQIPVIFRPWHESSGGWFFWGDSNCGRQDFLSLWNCTQDFINATPAGTGTLQDYIVWSFSPSYGGQWTTEQYLSRYPGDDRVQLFGDDDYQWGTEEAFRTMLDYNLSHITQIAREHGKLMALTECGYVNSPDATWWTRVVQPIIEQYPICYLLPWRNYKKEHFGASKDAPTADDFRQWATQKQFLFINDIKKIK